MIIIRTARIPIIKLETTTNVVADISLGDSSGPKAANYVAQQVSCTSHLSSTFLLQFVLRPSVRCELLLPCNHVMQAGLDALLCHPAE